LSIDLSGVRLAAFDVDGVLTDGTLLYSGDDVLQGFDARDGAGIMELIRSGIHVALVSFRDHPATRRRARDLGITLLCLGSIDKEQSMKDLCRHLEIEPSACLFMGDDVRDIPALRYTGFPACPADAHPDVLSICRIITDAAGGHGAVRELAEMILDTEKR
jgi:3-deoxy-D-manno-octulosonate 8-phosphate phosphatase (KDO 8-P phosphatase)